MTATPTSRSPATVRVDQTLWQAFDRAEPAPRRPSKLYQFNVVAVAVAMVTLPLIYVGLLTLLGYALFKHAAGNFWLLAAGKGGFLLYLAPLIFGPIVLFFLAKPVLAPRARQELGPTLDPREQPLFYEFLRRLCDNIGAPMPRRIELDCDVNAAASYRRGVWSMLLGGDLVLTIGLPLVSGLRLDQFAGILAHELGHFTQGMGMRASFVIRRITLWFARVVYERDAWDQWIAVNARGDANWFSLILLVAQGAIWCGRRVLWLLMMAGHLLSMFMLRQMEFDADRYETHVAGPEAFESTMKKVMLLDAASGSVHRALGESYRENRLADDLPTYIAARARAFEFKSRNSIADAMKDAKTSWFSSHPAPGERVARAESHGFTGFLHSASPASDLFHNYAFLCKAATFAHYRGILGRSLDAVNLIPTEQLVGKDEQSMARLDTLEAFYGGVVPSTGPMALSAARPPAVPNLEMSFKQLLKARQAMQAGLAAAAETYRQIDEVDEILSDALRVVAITRAQVPVKAKQTKAGVTSEVAAWEKHRAESMRREHLVAAATPFEEAARVRLLLGLALLETPAVAAKLPGAAKMAIRTRELLKLLGELEPHAQARERLGRENDMLAVVLEALNRAEKEPTQVQVAWAVELAKKAHRGLTVLRDALWETRYPFESATRGMTVGKHVFGDDFPRENEIGSTCEKAFESLQRLSRLQYTALGELAQMVGQVETFLKVKPLIRMAKSREAEK